MFIRAKKKISSGTWRSNDEHVEIVQDAMGGGGDAMETRSEMGRIWALRRCVFLKK